jgi:ribosomal protein S12 methylthiotransferase accessory factor
MEAIELYFAESPPSDHIASLKDMSGVLGYDPATLASQQGVMPPDHQQLEWSSAWMLHDGSPTFLPRELVNLDFTRCTLGRPWLLPTSNGLAGGNTWREAVLHGLYEVVERHSLRVTADKDIQERLISPDYFQSAAVVAVIDACRKAALRVEIEDRTCDLGVPCFSTRLIAADRSTAILGTGCHWSMEMAALKALLEAVQSRLTVITGARDDIDELDFCPRFLDDADKLVTRIPLSNGRMVYPASILHSMDLGAELAGLQRRLGSFGRFPIVMELAAEPNRFYVCFVVVPGLLL